MVTYTREQLEMAHTAGRAKIKFDDILILIEYMGNENRNGVSPGKAMRALGRETGNPLQPSLKTKTRRGSLSAKITRYLGRQGKKGAHVADIAKSLGTKKPNVVAWLYGTGKKLISSGEIKKTGKNTFALAK